MTFFKRYSAQHKQMFMLAIPMILSNITVPLLGLVDTAVVGHLDHAYYLGATSIGATIITFVTWICGFLRMSTTGLTAQSVGSNDTVHNMLTLGRGLIVALAIGLFCILLQQPFIELGLSMAGGSANVQAFARQYCEIRIYGLPAALANLVLVGWLLGNHKAKGVMWLIIVTNVTNVLLDLLFVMVFHWQVAGVAWATLLSEYCGLLVGLSLSRVLINNTMSHQKIKWQQLIERSALVAYFKLNRDIILRTMALELTFIFITFQGARLGDVVVAANAILLNFILLISFGLDGIANAAEVMVGKASGEKNQTKLMVAMKVSVFWTAIFAIGYSVFFALLGSEFIQLISSIPVVVNESMHYLVWIIILPVIACWCYVFDGIYIGLMQAKIMRNSMIFSTFLCFFPAWWLMQDWGNHSLWAALMIFMLARGSTLAGHFYWKNVYVKNNG